MRSCPVLIYKKKGEKLYIDVVIFVLILDMRREVGTNIK